MTTPTEIEAERLREILAGCEGVTPGPWEADGVRNEGGSGRFESYQVLAVTLDYYGKPPALVDTINSERIELHEDGDSESHSVWDEQGRKDTAHIARLDPATVANICTLALEALDRRAKDKADAAWNRRREDDILQAAADAADAAKYGTGDA